MVAEVFILVATGQNHPHYGNGVRCASTKVSVRVHWPFGGKNFRFEFGRFWIQNFPSLSIHNHHNFKLAVYSKDYELHFIIRYIAQNIMIQSCIQAM